MSKSDTHFWKILQAIGRNEWMGKRGVKQGPGSKDKEIDEPVQVRADKPFTQAGAAEESQIQEIAKTCYKEMTGQSVGSETKPG